jgi:hypothetical protein
MSLCVLRTDTYASNVAHIGLLMAEAEKDFQALDKARVEVVKFGGERYRRTTGIEFWVEPATIVPATYAEIREMEFVLGDRRPTDDLVCIIKRTSGAMPPCDDCTAREFEGAYDNNGKRVEWRETAFVRVFRAADDLLKWASLFEDGVVLFPMSDCRALDGGSVPTWTVEIYDDYRE